VRYRTGKTRTGRFIFCGDIGERQRPIDRETLLCRMPTEELQLWTNDPLPRQIREQLMAEEMGINALRNPSGPCVLFDELPEPSRRVGTVPR
jgi:hypothetical protein